MTISEQFAMITRKLNSFIYRLIVLLVYFFIQNFQPVNSFYFGDDFIKFAHPHVLHWKIRPSSASYHESTTSVPEFAIRRIPDAIIIGAKKSGTRALLEFLRINPRIRAPGPEVHFFDKHFDEGVNWYRKQMPLVGEDQVVLEKSPSYFVGKHVPQRIHSLNPKMKLILVVRDPITRAISDYTQTHATHRNSSIAHQSFEELVSCKPRVSHHSRKRSTHCVESINASVGPIRIGIYHKHLQNWLRYFPLGQIYIADGERLVSDPAMELRAVERFLGLDPVITSQHFVVSKEKGFPCVRHPHGPPYCLPASKGRQHAPIEPQTLAKLRHFYSIENVKFFRLINRRFNWSS